jgi:hypothetical protein
MHTLSTPRPCCCWVFRDADDPEKPRLLRSLVAQFVGAVRDSTGEEGVEEVVLSVTGRAAVGNALITATRHLTAATMPAFVMCVMPPLLRVARGEWIEQDNTLTVAETTVLQIAALQVRGWSEPRKGSFALGKPGVLGGRGLPFVSLERQRHNSSLFERVQHRSPP